MLSSKITIYESREISIPEPAIALARQQRFASFVRCRANITGKPKKTISSRVITLKYFILSIPVTAGINFKRDRISKDMEAHSHAECDGSATVDILSGFVVDGVGKFTAALKSQLGDEFLNKTVSHSYVY